MAVSNNEELLKRIARLVKQNQELEEHIRKLEKLNEKLTRENEKIKTLDEKFSPETLQGSVRGKKREVCLNSIWRQYCSPIFRVFQTG